MTPTEWDAHERDWCSSCKYERRCVIKRTLSKNPDDELALSVTRRLGHCSQHAVRPKRTKKKKG